MDDSGNKTGLGRHSWPGVGVCFMQVQESLPYFAYVRTSP